MSRRWSRGSPSRPETSRNERRSMSGAPEPPLSTTFGRPGAITSAQNPSRREAAMTFKTIVAIVQNEKDAERVLDCALPLAARFESHLIGIHAEALPVPYTIGDRLSRRRIHPCVQPKCNEKRATELGSASPRAPRRSPASRPNGAAWRASPATARCPAFPAPAAPTSSSPPSRDPDGDRSQRRRRQRCSTRPAGPVLVVPYAAPPTAPSEACWSPGTASRRPRAPPSTPCPSSWRPTRPRSGRRRRRTMPRRSGTPPAPRSPPASPGTAPTSPSSAASAGPAIGDVLDNHVAETGADLLVMGAYSHSWLREFLFGGVTRTRAADRCRCRPSCRASRQTRGVALAKRRRFPANSGLHSCRTPRCGASSGVRQCPFPKKPSRSRGTSSTATPARSPGGWPASTANGRRSSASPAAVWCRPPSSRANSASA